MSAASCLAAAAAATAAAAVTWWWARRDRDRTVAREREASARAVYRADTEISLARREREQLLAEAHAADTAARIVDHALKQQGFNWWER